VHAQLLHPNIVTFYNAREIEGQLVMTKEFVPGVALVEKLKAGPIAWRESSRYASNALSALEYAHAHGIIHRGFSSSDLIITDTGIARLAGFGFAKSVSDPELTAAGVVIGALKYMSPEQVKGEAVDARCDIYSLGIVLYEMLVGRVPFDAKGQFEIMMAQVNTAPKHVSDVNAAVPRELGDLVAKALAKFPDERFQTAREFREAVERFSLSQDTEVTESKAVSSAIAELPKPVAEPSPLAETAPPASPAPLPDAWAIESALELAESKLATMELHSATPVADSSAFVETAALTPSDPWLTDFKQESIPKASVSETAQLSEAPVSVSPASVDWWTAEAAVAPPESKSAITVLEPEQPVVEAFALNEAPAIVTSTSLSDVQAVESAIASAEAKPNGLKSEVELLPLAAAISEPPLEPAQPVGEVPALNEAPVLTTSISLPDALAVEPALLSSEAKPNGLKSQVDLLPLAAAISEPPLEPAPAVAEAAALNEAPAIVSSTSLPGTQAIESAIVPTESKPISTESTSGPEPVTALAESPLVPQTPVLDWWTLNSQSVMDESKSPEVEFSLSPPEPEPATPVVATLAIADPPAVTSHNTPPDLWTTEWSPAPVESKPESAQLELLSAALEPAKTSLEEMRIAENPGSCEQASHPDLWVAEPLPNASESKPAAADLAFSSLALQHEEPAEEPLSLWTSGPPDTWVSEPVAPPAAAKPEATDLQSSSAAVEPPEAVVESAAPIEASVAPSIPPQEPEVLESEPLAAELAPQSDAENPSHAAAAAATAGASAPVARVPAQVNSDLLTALFGDTLLSRVSLALVICAITFFLGTVTLFAVLSVTKP
jgi:serine/threonine protein kinase